MPHKFDPSKAALLDEEERRRVLPPEGILRRIGLRRGAAFADVGCGTGYFTLPAAELVGESGVVYAIDVQEEMLKLLAGRMGERANIRPVKSQENSIPLPGGCVDVALLGLVLHELEGDGTLREVGRILRRGGTLGVVDWKKESGDKGPPVEERISREEAAEMLKKAGFAVVETFELPLHYLLVARKR